MYIKGYFTMTPAASYRMQELGLYDSLRYRENLGWDSVTIPDELSQGFVRKPGNPATPGVLDYHPSNV